MVVKKFKEGDVVVTKQDVYFKKGREGVVQKVKELPAGVTKVYVKFPTRKKTLFFYLDEIELIKKPKEIEWV